MNCNMSLKYDSFLGRVLVIGSREKEEKEKKEEETLS